ncbi:MAG: DUF2793 domain-containing protein [Parvularculaceae bacterium]|nr:DUF2793 domain-containing protein [Parvularculaceae bacterium]
MSESSQRLDLPYLMEAQAQKHVTVNETFRKLDALLHLNVKTVSEAVEPASPSEGDAYVLPAAATGAAWDSFAENDVAAFQDGAWERYRPMVGMTAYTEDVGIQYAFDGTRWRPMNQPAQVGVNATPDGTNRLSVKSDAALFSHDDVTPGSGDMRLVVNKDSAAKTASILFQTAFQGFAEFGLTGTNDFVIKVADDSGTFRDAIVIDRQTGAVSLPHTS